MKIGKPILAGLISLSTLAPCKAQAVQFVSETGISGVLNKEAFFYSGINACINKGKNFADIFAGVNVEPDKHASFVALGINNYSWTKNLSSWARETFVASKHCANSTLEVAPIRANVDVKKFNFSIAPAYALNNDFKNGATTQGFNPIVQATYSISPKETLFAEAKYTSEPAKNLFDTTFGKLKDNISYMVSYLRNF